MERGWGRLAELIRADAARFRSLAELADTAGLSLRTVEELTAGRRTRYRDTTLHAVESALGWEHGAALRVVEGGRLRREPDPGLARVRDAWPRLSHRDQRIVLAVIDAVSGP